MGQLPFDFKAGKEAKTSGLDLVETNNQSFVDHMRLIAKEIVLIKGKVSCDDLRVYARDNDIVPAHPNAWGAIFRGKGWKQVGRKKSKLVSNHAREIRIWTFQ